MFTKLTMFFALGCSGCVDVPAEMRCIESTYSKGDESYQIVQPDIATREMLSDVLGLDKTSEVLAYFTSTKNNWHIYIYDGPLTGKMLSVREGKAGTEVTWVCLKE